MPDWQTIATFLCLTVAGVFVIRRLLRLFFGTAQGGCGSCAANTNPPKTKPLVPLELPDQRR